MKKEEKRIPRSYKMAETPYRKAFHRGQKERKPLATLLERVAELYGKGWKVVAFPILQEIRITPKKKSSSKK